MNKTEVIQSVYKDLPQIIANLCRFGNFEPRIYYLNNEKKLAYLENCKVGSTSIINSLFGLQYANNPGIVHMVLQGRMKNELERNDGYKDYYIFTYVRNPFERMVSCYKDKIIRKNYWYRRRGYFAFIADSTDFDDFIDNLALVPDILSDRHFRSQYSLIYKRGKKLVDFVAKIETIQDSYSKFVEEYDLPPIENYNSTKKDDWMDYYSLDSAKKVYRRYKNDIIKFGYEEEYKKLLSYIKQKNKKGN